LFGNCRTTEIFKSKYFAEVSLDQWMALTPPELVEAYMKLNRQGNGRAAQYQSPVVPA
jgi:oxalate decarboxylase